MARVKYNSGKNASSVGKGPRRQPAGYNKVRERSPSEESDVSDRHRSKRAKTEDANASRDHSRARVRDQSFRYQDLHSEVRGAVLESALKHHRAHDLEDFKIPQVMHVNRQMRKEAMPIFFATNIFTAEVVSEWCDHKLDFHSGANKNAGNVQLSELLPDLDKEDAHGAATIKESDIRFRRVRIVVNVCPCKRKFSRPVGILSMEIDRQTVTTCFGFDLGDAEEEETMQAFNKMYAVAKEVIRVFGKRTEFNGYTIQDVKDVARCFKRL